MDENYGITENPEDPEPLDPLTCDACFEANLTEDVHIQSCVVCEELYCLHHASIIDPAHCAECLHDVAVTTETIQRTETHVAHETGKVYKRTRKARQIKIGGLHWLFTQRKIPMLNDAELSLAIEYHRAIYDSLIYEREKRRSDNFHRNAGKPFKINTSINNTVTTTETTVKKSKTVRALKPDKAAANLASLIEQLRASGMSMEQIKAMAVGKK